MAGLGTDEAVLDQIFTCEMCNFSSPYTIFTSEDLRGTIKFKEKLFCLEDPGEYGVFPMKMQIGGKCSLCMRQVCLDKSCSRFDRERFCATCDR